VVVVFMIGRPPVASAETLSHFRFEDVPLGLHSAWDNSEGARPDGVSSPFNSVVNTSDVFDPVIPATGVPNTASVQLNGSQAIQIGGGNDYDIGTGSLTVEAWIKSDGGVGYPMVAVGKTSYGTKHNGWSMIVFDDGRLEWEVRGPGSESIVIKEPAGLLDGQWHHIAGVMDRDEQEIRAYVDGALLGTPEPWTLGDVDLDGSQATFIGRRDGSWPNYFKGSIDEVRITAAALAPSAFLVPEPSTFILLSIGALGLIVFGRRKRR